MAPTASCSFYMRSKKKFSPDEDLYGALLLATTLREKRKTRFVSPSYKDVIFSRLKKNGLNEYKKFKVSCPPISFDHLPLIEFTYQIGINIWFQKSAKDVPVLARASTLIPRRDDLNLLSKTFTADNKSLR